MHAVDAVKGRILTAVREAHQSARRAGQAYGAVVEAVAEGLMVELSTADLGQLIATAWGDGRAAYTGLAARYVALARWELGRYAPRERPGAVWLGGRCYTSPVAALKSGHFTFRQVYETWRATLVPPLVRASITTPAATVEQWTLPLSGQRQRVLAHRGAWRTAVRLLITAPIATEILPAPLLTAAQAHLRRPGRPRRRAA